MPNGRRDRNVSVMLLLGGISAGDEAEAHAMYTAALIPF